MSGEPAETDLSAPTLEGGDDAALLRLFVERGDRAALDALFARHADPAYRFALRLSGSAADAEDILQAAFLEVFRCAANFRGGSSVKTWILGFVLNASRRRTREETRRRARQDRVAEQASKEAPPPVDPELAGHVRKALDELPELYRAPVWLHYGEGLTTAEVASVLDVPAETVRKQVSRGIERLRVMLQPLGAALSIAAILPTLAVETAPASLAGNLAALGTAAPVVKAGLVSKIAGATVAAIAIASSAALLWRSGLPTEVVPPELAEIERVVREWQPTPEERRFDEIGWAPSLAEALRLSRESGRPLFLVTQSGRIQLGRSDGGSQFLRSGALDDPKIIALLNAFFVPAYVSNAELDDPQRPPSEDRKLRDRIWLEARRADFSAGMDYIYLRDPDGTIAGSISLGEASSEALRALLEASRRTEPGSPIVKPSPQSSPPPGSGEALVLHLTARYLDGEGRVEKKRGSFHEVPAEDWLRLTPEEQRTLIPSKGESKELDPELAQRLLTCFHPADMSVSHDPDERNRMEEFVLRATRLSKSYVRIEGRLRMWRSFTQVSKSPERPVAAKVKGILEIEPDGTRIRSFRLITTDAIYGDSNFGVAVRSLR